MKIKVLQIISVFVLAIIIGFGCKVKEQYSMPDVDVPDVYYGAVGGSDDSLNLAYKRWQEFFADSVLIALIDTALENNIDLKIADAYVEISESKLKQSKANYYPSVGLTPFGYRKDLYSENYNNYGSNRARRNHGTDVPTSFYTERLEYQSSVDLSWEIDIWGKLSAKKRASKLAYMKTVEFQKAVRTSLIADISTTYFNLALLKAQIAVYKDNLSLNDNTLQIVQLQFKAGEVTSLAVKQTLSQKLRAQTLIPQLEREYMRMENRLNRLIGRSSREIDLKTLDLPMLDQEYVAGMPLQLVSNRPDVAAAEYQLRESYEKVGVARAMRYPSINLGASVGLNTMELDKLLNPAGSGFLLLNGMIFQPVFQQRKLKTNYEVALKEKEIAELEFRDKFMRAMNEVSNAMVAVQKLKEEYIIAQERVAAAQNAVKDASFLFRSGLANYLEVITAQREALDSQLNLERVKMQVYSAEVELYRSLGGGWR